MTEYFHVVSVDADPNEAIPREINRLWVYLFKSSPFVRWHCARPDHIMEDVDIASLIVLLWSDATCAKMLEEISDKVRSRAAPLLVVRTKDEHLFDIRGKGERGDVVQTILDDYPCYVQCTASSLSEEQRIKDLLGQLAVELPGMAMDVAFDPNDFEIRRLVDEKGMEYLKHVLTSYFPGARSAQILPAVGGWSGTALFRAFLDGEDNGYFFKLFRGVATRNKELKNHTKAQQEWLGEALVNLKPVPGLPHSVDAQEQAFPEGCFSWVPVCYESALTRRKPRTMLGVVYARPHGAAVGDFFEGAFRRLLDILETGQRPRRDSRMAWGPEGRVRLGLDDNRKTDVARALQDLKLYLDCPELIGSEDRQRWEREKKCWQEARDRIRQLIYEPCPAWLQLKVDVACGHIHGDPNMRNCLVNIENHEDLKLIDCGDYISDGRLVWDLAAIESDIKFVLMGSEYESRPFFDLDAPQLENWCSAERDAIARGLGYGPEHVPVATGEYTFTRRAYRLVTLVRHRARELSESCNDGQGIHYFAALLDRTLDSLKHREVRRTKKLLALYSAAEILRKFEHVT